MLGCAACLADEVSVGINFITDQDQGTEWDIKNANSGELLEKCSNYAQNSTYLIILLAF